ncbi:MAG: ATP-binding cassette domain-containing protein [Oceanospirillales bacterium]|nr:ATP-binding cassette domain-containing protein [Oceanospirillales bacterium]MBR9888530.1 ATP-binding cassette domain-containing protein [Oceanospirillales bacterium]
MSAEVILQANNITKCFGRDASEVRAVDDVSLKIRRGEMVLIMGPSGSGKTTLLSILGALLSPTAGSVIVCGTDISAMKESELAALRAQKVGFVFQAFNLFEALTVKENILFPASLTAQGIKGATARLDALLDKLGLNERQNALPSTLSGGEKQRVAIARAMINQPPIILADEPTGNLDSHKGQEVMMILHDIARDDDCAVLMVTHDPRVEEIADRVLWLEDGSLRDRKSELHSWVLDPVCGMRVDEWTATVYTEFENRKVVFCSTRCLERFNEEPEFYGDRIDPK